MKCSLPLLLLGLIACADQTIAQSSPVPAATDTAPPDDTTDPPVVPPTTDGGKPVDAGTDATIPPGALCTSTFGKSLTSGHGRLDGTVRAVIVPSDKKCHGDDDHVLLQVDVIEAGTKVTYPIAVNILSDVQTSDPQVRLGRTTHALVGPAYASGWHDAVDLDYASSLLVHDTSFAAKSPTELASTMATEIPVGAQVSVYGYGYAGGDGAHKVHRNGFSDDGAIVVQSGASSNWLLFHFSQQTF